MATEVTPRAFSPPWSNPITWAELRVSVSRSLKECNQYTSSLPTHPVHLILSHLWVGLGLQGFQTLTPSLALASACVSCLAGLGPNRPAHMCWGDSEHLGCQALPLEICRPTCWSTEEFSVTTAMLEFTNRAAVLLPGMARGLGGLINRETTSHIFSNQSYQEL